METYSTRSENNQNKFINLSVHNKTFSKEKVLIGAKDTIKVDEGMYIKLIFYKDSYISNEVILKVGPKTYIDGRTKFVSIQQNILNRLKLELNSLVQINELNNIKDYTLSDIEILVKNNGMGFSEQFWLNRELYNKCLYDGEEFSLLNIFGSLYAKGLEINGRRVFSGILSPQTKVLCSLHFVYFESFFKFHFNLIHITFKLY